MNYRNVANVLGLLVLLALVIPFVIYAVPAVIGAQYSFVVLSGSMSPAIDPGDVVIVGEVDPATVAEGDVITFVRGDADAPVTHRVIGVEEAGSGLAFETMGDANREPDANPVPAANVIGAVVLTIPYIGYVVQAVNTTTGFVLLVVVPLVLFVASELWSLFRSARSDGGDDDSAATEADESGTDERTGTAAERTGTAAESNGEITISGTDLTLSMGILAIVAPYAVYVAVELRTTLSISAAFAATLSLLAVGGLWLLARRHDAGTGADAEAVTGDGPESDEGDPEAENSEPERTESDAPTGGSGSEVTDDGEAAVRFEEFEPAVESTTATDGGEEGDR